MADAQIACPGSKEEFSQSECQLCSWGGAGTQDNTWNSDVEAQGLWDAAPSPSWEPPTAPKGSPGLSQAGDVLAGLPETSEHPFPAGIPARRSLPSFPQ